MDRMPTVGLVTSIDRALTVLEVLSQSKKGLTNSEVSRKLTVMHPPAVKEMDTRHCYR